MMQQQQQPLGGGAPPARSVALEHASPSTRLLEKRRQMFEVQEALEVAKQEFACKEDAFRRREEALKKRDLELQESLIRFSKFLQENDSKRTRADKKAADEAKNRHAKEREIEQLTEVLEQLRDEKERVHDVLDKYSQYQGYLEGVLEACGEFQEIQDLLLRHAALQATHDDLGAHQQAVVDEAGQIRLSLAAFAKQRGDEVLDLNNTLTQLKKQLEEHEQRVELQELEKDSALRVASRRTLEYGQVVLCAENVFARCRQVSHIARLQEADPLAQLDAVGNVVSDLLAIGRLQRASAGGGPGGAA